MNQFNFNQVGGFPMTTRILDELQKAFAVFNALGALSGDKTIISGCVTTGSNVSDGVVYVNGEVFEFKGGTAQSKVKIVEVVETLVFEDGAAKSVIKTRYVTFGTGVGAMDWVDFKRGIQTKELEGLFLEKANKNSFDALADAFALVYTKLLTIESGAQKNKDEFFDYGTVTTQNRQNGTWDNDFTKNFAEVLPPDGYTMANLKAFIPSIAKIAFDGNVNDNDVIWCKYQVGVSKITVICNNTENKAAAEINYLAIWKK